MKVHFENVGRNKLSWTAEMGKLTHASLMRQINSKRALASRDVEFSVNDNDENQYSIYAGFHNVGTVRVEQ